MGARMCIKAEAEHSYMVHMAWHKVSRHQAHVCTYASVSAVDLHAHVQNNLPFDGTKKMAESEPKMYRCEHTMVFLSVRLYNKC